MNGKFILTLAAVVGLQGCAKSLNQELTIPRECQKRVPYFTKLPTPAAEDDVLAPETLAKSWKEAKTKYRQLTYDYVVCREFIKKNILDAHRRHW